MRALLSLAGAAATAAAVGLYVGADWLTDADRRRAPEAARADAVTAPARPAPAAAAPAEAALAARLAAATPDEGADAFRVCGSCHRKEPWAHRDGASL